MNIQANVSYLKMVLRHKWYVIRFGWGTVPLWRLIVHDASKFSRAEWEPYRDRFASGLAGKEDKRQDTVAFKDAWRHHWQSNPHHHEFWYHRKDWSPDAHRGDRTALPVDGGLVLEMPKKYVHEMVADWKAASKAYSGKNDCTEWYEATKERQIMHPSTRWLVEDLLGLHRIV